MTISLCLLVCVFVFVSCNFIFVVHIALKVHTLKINFALKVHFGP